MFCGAGGFSLGAHFAGFHSAVAVDLDENLTSSFARNFPSTKLLHTDISLTSGTALLRGTGLKSSEIVGVIGGPPCQGFSTIGKRESTDPRNRLLWHFCRLVNELHPRFFIMENVPGLLSGNTRTAVDEALSKLSGFEIVGPLLVDAHEYGAATRRKRVVIVGYDRKHVCKLTEMDFLCARKEERPSVRDAITDLPEPGDLDCLPYRRKTELCSYAQRARKRPGPGLGSSESRELLQRNLVSGLRRTMHTREVVKRFRELKQGHTDSVSRCPRLAWNEPAPTLRAGTGPDKGSFQSIRPIHPIADRVITVREAARLQGFPDWFQFHATKWHSFRMIGNSVSPFMSEAILRLLSNRVQP